MLLFCEIVIILATHHLFFKEMNFTQIRNHNNFPTLIFINNNKFNKQHSLFSKHSNHSHTKPKEIFISLNSHPFYKNGIAPKNSQKNLRD